MTEFERIVKANFGELKREEIDILRSFFYHDRMEKNDFFIQTGKYCRKLSLVKSGLLRIYRHSDGKEVTQWISSPNQFVTEISSFFFNEPSRLSIQALTDVELLTINRKNYEQLNEKLPIWKEVETQFMAKCFAILEDRVFSHLSMSTEERFDLFFHQNRELLNLVPLQYIASILGMTPETLSRIRKKRIGNS
ncbi:Crp/Fnr family transcriptional regulator [Flagellimonas profundi]|uniref:Crp/Fnr family transcriptional regulator n=1 Tax=Flagellimonas profundi TaxID=2915620 RepID=A0ABS3FJY4_9FLAO|nr:Crp/Fnr family transcriptional regulator [Allomuricauda profundi]MBO0343498.1 Crp/Fnr family transcriptional regulator [Allomuricauda profundi]